MIFYQTLLQFLSPEAVILTPLEIASLYMSIVLNNLYILLYFDFSFLDVIYQLSNMVIQDLAS